MPKLSELTDIGYSDPMGVALPVEKPYPELQRVYVNEPAVETPVEQPSAGSRIANSIINKLFRTDEQRYQLWPEKIVREGLTAAGDVMSGKVPTFAIDPVTGDAHTSPQMIEKAQAISALAGTGGLAGTDKAAGAAFGVVPVDIAKKLKFKTGKISDELKAAVDNSPAASIDADGHLILKIGRNQHPDQEMAESVRGGVFYLPEGSKNARYYNGTTNNTYGGKQAIEGETAFVNPLVVKGATGGKAPEAAYTQLMGKDAFKNLEKEIQEITTATIYRKEAPWLKQELTQKFLEKHAPELVNHADYILGNSTKGNQLRYALQEAAIASAARNAGYDGIVGYSVGRGANSGKPFLSEVFDVRENRYPSPSGDYSVHPELLADSSRPGAAIQANRASLRPALKHKERLYKGKPGQEHQDIIPDALYNDFQKKALSGQDLAEYNFGFINDKGHFLSREDALKYGIDNGIIDPHSGKFGALTTTLLADSSKPGVAIEAMAKANPFFSALEHNVANISQGKMNGEAWLGTLSNKPGVKPEELDWTGLRSFLEENKGKPVTKAEVENFLAENKMELGEVWKGTGGLKAAAEKLQAEAGGPVQVKGQKLYPDEIEQGLWDGSLTPKDLPTNLQSHAEKMLSLRYQQENPTKYQSYQLPGGENYREMLLTLPEKGNAGLTGWDKITAGSQNYKSSHWDEPNIIAHMRMNDRTIDGKKSLHLEEIQSDWHQAGRDKGYKITDTERKRLDELSARKDNLTDKEKVEAKGLAEKLVKEGVPDAPFKKTWHELALKRALREAAEKGYDRLSWTPGEAQAARYDLSKQIKALHYTKTEKGEYMLAPEAIGGREVPVNNGQPIPKDKLADYVGKEMAEKILKGPDDLGVHTIDGDGLKIGGEGMKGFYDNMIPKALEKLGKEHGVKVQKGSVENNKEGWHLTPPEHTVSGKWMVKSNDYNSKGQMFDTKEAAEAALKSKIRQEQIFYIDIPQSLRNTATGKGFPLFAKGGYMLQPVDYDPFKEQ